MNSMYNAIKIKTKTKEYKVKANEEKTIKDIFKYKIRIQNLNQKLVLRKEREKEREMEGERKGEIKNLHT